MAGDRRLPVVLIFEILLFWFVSGAGIGIELHYGDPETHEAQIFEAQLSDELQAGEERDEMQVGDFRGFRADFAGSCAEPGDLGTAASETSDILVEENYAAASLGAKVIGANKEAEGGGYVLNKDKDKHFRSPCSAEEKFVVVELSEETLVVTIAIANYELLSSNPRELELLGSLEYPTEEWKLLGRFEAKDVRIPQRFTLSVPEWARYLKLRYLSHYGTEFYCTLSTFEVFGDGVERMIEGWMGKRPILNISSSSEENQSQAPFQKVFPRVPQGEKGFSQVVLVGKVRELAMKRKILLDYIDYVRMVLLENSHREMPKVVSRLESVKIEVQAARVLVDNITVLQFPIKRCVKQIRNISDRRYFVVTMAFLVTVYLFLSSMAIRQAIKLMWRRIFGSTRYEHLLRMKVGILKVTEIESPLPGSAPGYISASSGRSWLLPASICDGKRARHEESSPDVEYQILESDELYFGDLERDEAEISVELDGVEILSARTALSAAESHEEPMENTTACERLKKVTTVSLKDYKRMVSWASESDKWNTTIKHRLEPGGEEFNFAAASHGAQIVTSSSDGGNLLKDKYFRSPCKAKEKSFVLQLAEEVLVDTVVIENHELYSSNPRELEVLGTLRYPTESWRLLGNVEAQNICRPQRFVLPKPEWARYLKLRILSHYGNEYYCTLNHLQIFGSGLEGLIEEAQPYCEQQQQDATQIHKLQEELRLLKSQMADDVLYVAIAVLVVVSAVLVYPWMGTIVYNGKAWSSG
ncbi:hypothetical protein SELMODRAFT_411386 [Selaginella moellendorffii]|uniref:SUN domain-containing protein n=1 Tax=Selaginella moellendorffii TaxID=88036 RepID=D8RHG9_SELML|nr:hypothetical protein SELMODRAFT_411386 [Selaginella moellendorffii]